MPVLVAVALGTLLVLAAVGRQRGLEAIAPGDLAAFHQASWSAAHGRGFAQTALSFEGQTLTKSVHLSMVRALWVPLYRLIPSLYLLVALQAAAIGFGLFLVGRIAREAGAGTALSALVVLVVGISPLCSGLATADLRPLVFMVPGVLSVVLGLVRPSLLLVLLGASLTILCREEAPLVLGSLIPLAWWRGRRHHRRAPLLALGLMLVVSLLVLLGLWGKLSTLSTNDAPGAVLADILAGQRPIFRSPSELRLGLRALAAAAPSLAAGLATLPGALAWFWLAVFSVFEPAIPGQPGAHYLAVVFPFLAAGTALGLPWLCARVSRPRLLSACTLLVATAAGLPELRSTLRLVSIATLGPSPEVAAVQHLIQPVLVSDGGVLCEPALGPLLAGREQLYLRGMFTLEPGMEERLLPHLDWALLKPPRPGKPSGIDADRRSWKTRLSRAGLAPRASEGGYTLWSR